MANIRAVPAARLAETHRGSRSGNRISSGGQQRSHRSIVAADDRRVPIMARSIFRTLAATNRLSAQALGFRWRLQIDWGKRPTHARRPVRAALTWT